MILDNVRVLCEKKKITIAALERELGFGNGTIGRWDKASPTIDKLQAVANYFHVKVDRLLRKPEAKQ